MDPFFAFDSLPVEMDLVRMLCWSIFPLAGFRLSDHNLGGRTSRNMSIRATGQSIFDVKIMKQQFLYGVVTAWLLCHVNPVWSEDRDKLSLADGDAVVMTYNAGYLPSPDADAPWFGRSGFIHPVYTPGGRIVTDGFPSDHMHQHGLMFAWTNALFDGRSIDFWNSAAKVAHIEHVATIRADADEIIVQLRHLDDTTAVPTAVLNETWQVTRVPHESMHVFDLVSTQTCATTLPLKINQYHYGAMCIRGPVSWLEKQQGSTMLTSEGKDRKAGNHSRPNWVTMSGQVDGAPCGITAMSHPENFRAPQPVRLHPNKPYFCFAPMVLGDFQIEPGKPYVSRYRFVAFDGRPDVEDFQALWQSFVEK